MTDFETAARKAAEEINNGLCFTCTGEEQRKTDADFITKHYAEIEATYKKLVECIECLLIGRATNGYTSIHWQAEMNRKLADPTIAALVERMRG